MPTTPNRDGGRLVEDSGQFDDVVDDSEAVLAHFAAEWSRPCRRVDADLAALAAEQSVETVRVDVESNPVLAAEFAVQSLPTLLLFVDGEPVARREGVCDREALADLIETHLA